MSQTHIGVHTRPNGLCTMEGIHRPPFPMFLVGQSPLVFVSPVLWTGKRPEPDRTWTAVQFIRWQFIGTVRTSPVASLSFWEILLNWRKLVQANLGLVLSWEPIFDHVSTYIPLDFGPWVIRNSQELSNIWPKSFYLAYFVISACFWL
jgi:uncharacterized membrane protein